MPKQRSSAPTTAIKKSVRKLLKGCGMSHIVMPKSAFIKEHKKLIKILKEGKPKALKKEAKEQSKELSEQLKGGMYSPLANQLIHHSITKSRMAEMEHRLKKATEEGDELRQQIYGALMEEVAIPTLKRQQRKLKKMVYGDPIMTQPREGRTHQKSKLSGKGYHKDAVRELTDRFRHRIDSRVLKFVEDDVIDLITFLNNSVANRRNMIEMDPIRKEKERALDYYHQLLLELGAMNTRQQLEWLTNEKRLKEEERKVEEEKTKRPKKQAKMRDVYAQMPKDVPEPYRTDLTTLETIPIGTRMVKYHALDMGGASLGAGGGELVDNGAVGHIPEDQYELMRGQRDVSGRVVGDKIGTYIGKGRGGRAKKPAQPVQLIPREQQIMNNIRDAVQQIAPSYSNVNAQQLYNSIVEHTNFNEEPSQYETLTSAVQTIRPMFEIMSWTVDATQMLEHISSLTNDPLDPYFAALDDPQTLQQLYSQFGNRSLLDFRDFVLKGSNLADDYLYAMNENDGDYFRQWLSETIEALKSELGVDIVLSPMTSMDLLTDYLMGRRTLDNIEGLIREQFTPMETLSITPQSEAEEEKEEGEETGGSKQSGFIQRMMSEVKLKNGEYRNPTSPLSKESKMNKPVAFDYFKMPKESREMSKHIMTHLFRIRPYKKGEREKLNETELKMLREAEAERQRKSRAKRREKSQS